MYVILLYKMWLLCMSHRNKEALKEFGKKKNKNSVSLVFRKHWHYVTGTLTLHDDHLKHYIIIS